MEIKCIGLFFCSLLLVRAWMCLNTSGSFEQHIADKKTKKQKKRSVDIRVLYLNCTGCGASS